MKIAWFTPFSHKSAIGKYSNYATKALEQHAQIVIYAPKDENMHSTTLPVVFFDENDELENLSDEFDYIVYNMGDNSIFHKGIYNIMKKHAGIVIIHDICMFNFFWMYFREDGKVTEHMEMLRALYGENKAQEIESLITNPETRYKVDMSKYNMLEALCKNALGIIVHSKEHERKIKEVYDGCVTMLPLIKMCEEIKLDHNGVSPYNNHKINILTVGTVNQNKLVAEVILAIASSETLLKNACYSVVGETTDKIYQEKINELMKTKGIQNCVNFLGYKSDEELELYYNFADITCNLRYPVYEGGSATLQEQLINGKTTLIANTGAYKDVPDDCAIKVNIENIVANLTKELEYIINNVDEVKKIGLRAQKYAKDTYNKDKYIKGFLEFLNDNMKELVYNKVLYIAFDNIKHVLRKYSIDIENDKRENRISRLLATEAEKLFYTNDTVSI